MARKRYISPMFFKDEDLADLSPWARLCFAGLPTLADREGRLEERPKLLKTELFPYDDVNIPEILNELSGERNCSPGSFICRYELNQRHYIQIRNFQKYQNPHPKEPPSEIPPCPEDILNKGIYPKAVKRNGRAVKKRGEKLKKSTRNASPSSPSEISYTCNVCSGEHTWWNPELIKWDKKEKQVQIELEAREGIKCHLQELASQETLKMLTRKNLQESWGRLNTHLLTSRHKTGPKTLPTLTVRWFENDMRRISGYVDKGKTKSIDRIRRIRQEMSDGEEG